ncbi:C2H2 type master regulator of conidiophore development BrlA [Cladobotryum mycophilum]|uniref:C2H2 type master regulator of conidiophore development BrlA n=1 Tax=Cladobotryum mycophilum TaxID=491253 RepID=A0ABR0T032_9HYPO
MQFESEFRLEMDDNFNNMCSQTMLPSTTNGSFSSASSSASTYDPFTPTSRRSTPHELNLEFDGGCQSFGLHHGEITPPPGGMPKYPFNPIKAEPDRSMSFSEGTLPSTPLRRLNEIMPGYDHMLDVGMASQHAMGSLTPSSSFPIYTVSPHAPLQSGPFMMTPTHSLSGSDMADHSSSWSCTNDSPIFFPQKGQSPHDMESLDLNRYSQSPMGRYYLHGAPVSPHRLRTQRKMMVHEIQRKTTELQRAQIQSSQKISDKHDSVDVVRKAMCKCDYPNCHKAFRRNEHLKRHKQTFHGEGPNKFMCEFCGKDQFNRQDNLNNHRKLHARPNSRNRGVEFIPAAVAVIEQEERSRKRRAPPKSKTVAAAPTAGEKRGNDYE